MTLWITLTICCILTASASAQDNSDQEAKNSVELALILSLSRYCEMAKYSSRQTYEQYEKKPDLSKLTLNYITTTNTTKYNLSSLATIPSQSWYKAGKPLVIFCHGFTGNPTGQCSTAVREGIQNNADVNMLLLDSSAYISYNYFSATTFVRFIAEDFGSALANFTKAGHNASSLHLIGHSLGAHIVGLASKQLFNITGLKPGRTTGLDPAGPCYNGISPSLRINKTDADYVDILHSNAGVYGLNENVGARDYWPNNGTKQPGCLEDFCSHSLICNIFGESVANATGFPAVNCNTRNDFATGTCNNSDISFMGYYSKPGTEGRYYLKTASKSPYALGTDGIK